MCSTDEIVSCSDNAQDEEFTMYIGEDVCTSEYAPALFEAIRRMDQITDAQV